MLDYSQYKLINTTKDLIVSEPDDSAIEKILRNALFTIPEKDKLSFIEHLQTLLLSIQIDKFLVEGQDLSQSLANVKIAKDILAQIKKERAIKQKSSIKK